MNTNEIIFTSRGLPHEKPRRYRYYIGRRRFMKANKKAWEKRKLTARERHALLTFAENHPECVVKRTVWTWPGATVLRPGEVPFQVNAHYVLMNESVTKEVEDDVPSGG